MKGVVSLSGKITREELHIDLNNELDRKVEIDDNLTTSSDKTYSINKINQLVDDVTIDSISATKVIQTPELQFVSASKSAQIDANTSDITSHGQRIADLENRPISESDGKVKVNENDISDYLSEKIDNDTIKISGGKLSVELLTQLLVTIEEINQLQGVTGNIQSQLNAITSIGNFTHTVQTYADLMAIAGMQSGDMVIVLDDENAPNGDVSTIYVYNGSDWQYSGKFKAGEIRDFLNDPLNINTETTGMLSKNRYEKQNAQETPFTDPNGNLLSTNVRDAVSELFTLANNIKSGVANVVGFPANSSNTTQELINIINQAKVTIASNLMDKGLVAYQYEPLSNLVNKVAFIPNVEISAGLKRVTKLNIQAPYTYTIELERPLRVEDVCATVLELVGADSDVVHYEVNFDNSDASSFDFDPRFVEFDGHMKLKEKHLFNLTKISEIEEEFELYESEEIDLDDYVAFGGGINVSDTDIQIEALPRPQVIKANGDILLNGVDSLDSILFTAITSGSGIANIVASFDSGISYHAYVDDWIEVEVDNTNAMITKGMNKAIVDTLTNDELSDLRGESNFLRFAYVLAKNSFDDVAYNDALQLKVTMQGRNEIADTSKYSYSYDQSAKKLTFNFKQSGTYSITYADGGE